MHLTDPVPVQSLRRVLVIKLRHHGDVLLTAPVFHVLKARHPACEIDALVYSETAPMLAGHPAIAHLHTIRRDWKRAGLVARLAGEWALMHTLRSRRYDLVLHLTDHPRGAWIARLCGARWAVGPQRQERGGLWKHSFSHLQGEPRGRLRHAVERNLDALRRIGIHPEPEEKRLSIHPDAAAQARAAALLEGLGGEPFILVHPVSRWMFKSWPPEKVAQVCARLQGRGWKIVLTAGPDPEECAYVEKVRAGLPQAAISLAGQLSLAELAALIGRSRLFFGVDSAPMHIAAAQGVPVVALFGPSGEDDWGPWQVPHRVVASDEHPCRPCGIDGCGSGKLSDCLRDLPVARVTAAIDDLLAQTRGADEAPADRSGRAQLRPLLPHRHR